MTAYSFMDVDATIVGPGGAFPLGSGAGIAEEGITIEYGEDKDTMSIGADGTPMHSLHASKAGTATVRLQKTSPTNQQLSIMYDLQTASSAMWGVNVIAVRHRGGGDIVTCRAVAFRRLPANTYAKDGGMMEWAFNVGKIDQLLGDWS